MLSEVFTKKNLEVLELVLDKEMHIRDIADELKISPAKVHNAVKLFRKYKLIKERKSKNRIIILPNSDSKILQKIIELIKLTK